MTAGRIFALLTVLATMLLIGASASAQQAQGTTSIAVVNPAKAFNDMLETRDLKQKLDAERQAFENEAKARQQKVTDLRSQRDLLKMDSPQYQDLDRQLVQVAIEFDTWSKVTQAQAQRNQKMQMRILFDKIVAATGEVAQQKGLDIVIADQRPELPENMDQINVEQLRAAINSRNVLFASQKADITNDVIANLDNKYKAGGGAPAAGGTAPAGGAAPAGGLGGGGARGRNRVAAAHASARTRTGSMSDSRPIQS